MDGLRMEVRGGASEAERAVALCERVDLLLELNRPQDARAIAAEALTLDPSSVAAHCQLARVLKAQGDLTTALKAAETAVVLDPQEEWGHRLRALILLDAGKGELALEAALEAVRLDPEQPGVLHCIVRCAAATGRGKLARIWAERGRDLQPGDASAHALLGTVAMDERDWRDAETHLRRSLEIDASCWATVYNLGLVLQSQGRPKEAITTFYQAAQLAPADASSQAHLYGLISRGAGRARLVALVLALAIAIWLIQKLGVGWLFAGAIGATATGLAYFAWERRWLASLSVPVGSFYRRKRWWAFSKRMRGLGRAVRGFIEILASICLCFLPISVPVALVRLAIGDWLTPLCLLGVTAIGWFILRRAPARDEQDSGIVETVAPGETDPQMAGEMPEDPAPLVPLRELARATVRQVDAVLGSPQSVAPVLTQPELMPGEYREYLLTGQGILLVRFHEGQAVSFSALTKIGQSDNPVGALGVFFGLEPSGLTVCRRTATEQIWAGVAGSLSFSRIRVGYKVIPGGDGPTAPCFNSAEAVL